MRQLLAILLWLLTGCRALRCLDEQGKEVDWFVVYKIPQLATQGAAFAEGRAYAFLTSDDLRPQRWRLAAGRIEQNRSLLANTLAQVYQNPDRFTYVQYNDEAPDAAHAACE